MANPFATRGRPLLLGAAIVLALLTSAHADDFLSLQVRTGNDDLRSGSRFDLLLELGDNSIVVVPVVTGGVRLPDEQQVPFGPLAIGQSVDPTDIRRLGARFVAARGGGLEDDKWVLRSITLSTGSSTTLTQRDHKQLEHKFESDGIVFSDVLQSFDPGKLRPMTALTVGIDTADDNLEPGGTVDLVFGIDGESPRSFVLVPAPTKLVDRNRNYFTVPLSPAVARDQARSILLRFHPSGNDEWHVSRVDVDATDVGGNDRVFDGTNVIPGVVKLKKSNDTFAPPAFPPFPVKPPGPHVFILVLDESSNRVAGAEVFVDASAAGMTDGTGLLDLGTITLPRNIFVRKRIHEQPTYRNNHSADSTQNWNYRVYLTNAWVGFGGLVTPLRPNDPNQLIVATVRRDRVLFGLNIVASLEWDGDLSDLLVQEQKIVNTSQFLFNATDGQFFIDRCTIMDARLAYDDADYRVHAEAGLRAEVNDQTGGFLGNNLLGSSMQMSRTSDFATYAHEFGHYGFDLEDEYDTGNLLTACSSKALVVASPFTALDASMPDMTQPWGFKLLPFPGNPLASCMMWRQKQCPKLCSGREDNPHATGTSQGDTPCWEKLRKRYLENAAGRWKIVTPTDRAAILGPIDFPVTPGGPPGPHPLIGTTCTYVPHDEDRTVGHVTLTARDVVGTPVPNLLVWLQTATDLLFEGRTNGAGQLDLAGCHVGDTVIVGAAVMAQPTGQATITGPTVTVIVM